MITLTIKTDKPEAELALYQDQQCIAREQWYAHRELSIGLLQHIETLLTKQHRSLQDLGGIVAFLGPGSFTGLRIGLTVANSLSYGLSLPIVGNNGEAWEQNGVHRIINHENDKVLVPQYGAPVHITQQKK